MMPCRRSSSEALAASEAADGSPVPWIRREPTLPEHESIAPESPTAADLFAILVDEADDEPVQASMIRQRMRTVARQAALDPGDGLDV